MKRRSTLIRLAITLCLIASLSSFAFARTRKAAGSKKKTAVTRTKVTSKSAKRGTRVATASRSVAVKTVVVRGKRGRLRRVTVAHDTNGLVPAGGRAAGGPWLTPTFAESTTEDNVDGEDLTVRRAAVDALGPFNGSVVVVDPQSGRILSMVNQKLALSNGYQPCSTVKVLAGLAGLSEGTVEGGGMIKVGRRFGMNLTNAMAFSNNYYFANIGSKLGYDKISHYGKLFGYGEKAGLNIEGEKPGIWPDEAPANGGMGMMTSFGEGISQTPLQLAALVSAVANGGTLMYLQYPKTQAEAEKIVPKAKRELPITNFIEDVKAGMSGAVQFGTARRAAYENTEFPIYGKTGTCTDSRSPTHLGWFGSFNEVNGKKLTVVVLLTGGRQISGPIASGIAGQVYKNLGQRGFFNGGRSISPVALIKGSSW